MCIVEKALKPQNSVYTNLSNTSSDVRSKYKVATTSFPASILLKSISDRYWPDSIPVGPITVRYRFKQNASWVSTSPYVRARVDGVLYNSYF